VIVLDSSFLIAWHNSLDVHHRRAAPVMQRFLDGEWGPGLLLEYVLLEVVTFIAIKRRLAAASSVANLLLRAREIEFIPCSDFFLETLETFRTQVHGSLSFTDAAIVTVARRSGGLVATFDTGFRGMEGIAIVPA